MGHAKGELDGVGAIYAPHSEVLLNATSRFGLRRDYEEYNWRDSGDLLIAKWLDTKKKVCRGQCGNWVTRNLVNWRTGMGMQRQGDGVDSFL